MSANDNIFFYPKLSKIVHLNLQENIISFFSNLAFLKIRDYFREVNLLAFPIQVPKVVPITPEYVPSVGLIWGQQTLETLTNFKEKWVREEIIIIRVLLEELETHFNWYFNFPQVWRSYNII